METDYICHEHKWHISLTDWEIKLGGIPNCPECKKDMEPANTKVPDTARPLDGLE